jgi:hypothetical protein
MRHEITSHTFKSSNLESQQARHEYVAPKLEIHGKYNLLTCGISAGLGLSDPSNLEQN